MGPIERAPAAHAVVAYFGDDDQRFRKNLLTTLLIAVVMGVVMPLIPMPPPEPEEVLELPERVVRFIDLSQEGVAPPAPVVEQPKPEEPEPTPEPVLANEQAPERRRRPSSRRLPRPRWRRGSERKRPACSRSARASRTSPSADPPRRSARQRASATQAPVTTGCRSGRWSRRWRPGSSGGINLASFSRQVGGDGGGGGSLEGVEVGRVTSNIGEGPGGAGRQRARAIVLGPAALAGRTDEEIQIVFDRYKASLYRLYNRELRKNPALRGQMVLRLTIEPSGAVSFLELQSSDMNAPALAQQVLERVRTFDFGAKDVAAITIVYPIDFLPAA